MPKKHQPEVKAALQAIASANSERAATAGRDAFARMDGRAHPKTVERLERDWARRTASYAFPTEHWKHRRTTNVIERLENLAGRRAYFRALNAPHLCTAVSDGVLYRDGVREWTPTRKRRAA